MTPFNALERCELRAAAFSLHTQLFPPGKDAAAASGQTEEDRARASGAWDVWCNAYGAVVDCVFSAAHTLERTYKQAYDDAMVESNRCGYVGLTPAETIERMESDARAEQDRLREQADAWMAVCNLVTELDPHWPMRAGSTGMDSMCSAIKRLAERGNHG